MKKFAIMTMLAALGFVVLGACGKMSDPAPLEGSGYPHVYQRK